MKDHITREDGQQFVLLALLLGILLGCLGLVADVGNAYMHHRKAQNAADAAATAAGMVLYLSMNEARASALYYADQHGYTTGVTVGYPTSGPYAGNSRYIEVIVEEDVEPIFASVIWPGTFHVRARAVAGYRAQGKGPPVIVLNETLCQTLSKNGSGHLRVYNGGIQVNSPCADAARLVGPGDIITDSPSTIVGSYTLGGNSVFSPEPLTGQPVMPDPLAYLPAPYFGSYTVQSGTPTKPALKKITGGATLNPGIYYGGLSIESSAPVVLNPGVYIMAGGGFKFTGSGSVTGSNIFIYITEDPYKPTGDGEMGDLDLHGSGALNISAPNSGTYAGIIFFQDRRNTKYASITGSSTWTGVTGVVYIKKAELELKGTINDAYASFVVDRLTLSGVGTLRTYGYAGPGWLTIDSTLSE